MRGSDHRSILAALAVVCGLLAACGDNFAGTPPSSAREITAYSFEAANNPALASDVDATIIGNSIALVVPFDTDVTALVATFATTGEVVTVNGTRQASGSTPNDFTTPVSYRVTAEDGTTRDYTVDVTLASSAAKEITAYSFQAADNAALTADVTATINGSAIAATVPFGADVTALVATFATTGQGVTVGATAQVSGTTANDFTQSVTYRVTAADASTRDYTVTVTVAADSAKEITAYSFLTTDNPGLTSNVIATISGDAIAATVPAGTDVTALVATFSTTGQSVTVGGAAQVSGTTANDFTSPVVYRVTAADTTTRDYTVTVTIAPGDAKDLTSFELLAADNAGLGADVIGVITGTDVAVTVPFGTDVTQLVATFATTGQAVSVAGTTQVSGTTANDFTSPVVYTVTAEDTTTQDYTVTVTIAPGDAKDLTSFEFLTVDNAGLATDIVATITGTDIAATVPFGTDVTALIARFQTTGDSVTVGAVTQTSGMTANDFTAPVVYTVTALDASAQDFTVTVTVAPSPAKDLTAFSFLAADNAALSADVTATITGTDVAATVPFGTDVTALVASFTHTGATVAVAGTTQASGTTPNDFTNPVLYTVTAADNSSQDYTVTVTVALNPAKDITAFSFLADDNIGLDVDVPAMITGTDITATIPFGPDVTALVATFVTTGASVTVGATTQVSGTTPNDFTVAVIYTVTAGDGTTQDYTVTLAITCEPLAAPDHGDVTVSNSGIAPSTATYTCDRGFGVNGASTRTCTTGTYDDTAPTCDRTFLVAVSGDGDPIVAGASTALAVEERLVTTGALVRTIPLPIAASGAHSPITLSSSASSEGHLALSVDGRYVTLAGYAVEPGVAGIAATTNLSSDLTPTNRVVARIDADGGVDTSTRLLDAFSGSSPRGAVTIDGSAFWATGDGTAATNGVQYQPLGATTSSTRILSSGANLNAAQIIGGQLYANTTTQISRVGTGTPTTGSQTLTAEVSGVTSARGFVFLDRDPMVAGIDTVYIARDSSVVANTLNIQKLTFNGAIWLLDTLVVTFTGGANTTHLAAFVEGTGVRIVATQSLAAGNRIFTFVDDGSATVEATAIATAPTNFRFRGVAPSPTAAP
jgi:hypothetical protein